MEKELRKRRCCFTGHRPEKLQIDKDYAREVLEKEIKRAIDDNFTTFISGMARGIDMWSAEIVLKLKETNPNLKLVCAIPYKGFETKWSRENREEYHHILKKADLVHYFFDSYKIYSFQVRNKWMVDKSARVIALYNGSKGGTQNTINYAKEQSIETVILTIV